MILGSSFSCEGVVIFFSCDQGLNFAYKGVELRVKKAIKAAVEN